MFLNRWANIGKWFSNRGQTFLNGGKHFLNGAEINQSQP
jgi:hypothetical protein